MESLLQLPRLYNVYKEMGIVTSFQNMLDNIFLPLFEVTVDPDSHPQLNVFLKQVWYFIYILYYQLVLDVNIHCFSEGTHVILVPKSYTPLVPNYKKK